jgi:hypothetical protein
VGRDMNEVLPALVTAGAGVVVLVLALLLVLRPVRRFARAGAELRTGVADRVRPLRDSWQEIVNFRRRGHE